MAFDPVELTSDFINIKSESKISNALISDLVEDRMEACGLAVERLEYVDEYGERKVSLVGKKGEGSGGLVFMSHTDTVPGQEQDWAAFQAEVRDDRLFGRGSCDMKGPLAATMIAAAAYDASQLKQPIFVTATADEEVGGRGARQVAVESKIFNEAKPPMGVVAEPTSLTPVYAHKGGSHVLVEATGEAAHTSTELGVSANFLIAPFLAEMAELNKAVKTDERFMNHDFNPPTNGFNITINDFGTKQNVFAARSSCYISFRTMPGDKSGELVALIVEKARQYNLKVVSSKITQPFYVDPSSEVVRIASECSQNRGPRTVPYGTDALQFHDQPIDLVVLGPGSIEQAHTVGEYVDIPQLYEAVEVYKRMIDRVCL